MNDQLRTAIKQDGAGQPGARRRVSRVCGSGALSGAPFTTTSRTPAASDLHDHVVL